MICLNQQSLTKPVLVCVWSYAEMCGGISPQQAVYVTRTTIKWTRWQKDAKQCNCCTVAELLANVSSVWVCDGAKSSIHTFLHQKQNPATCQLPHLPVLSTPIHPSSARGDHSSGRSRLRLAAGEPLDPTHTLRGWAVRCQQWSALVHVWLICSVFNVFTWEQGNEAEHVLITVKDDCSGPLSRSVWGEDSEGSRPQHPEEGLVFCTGGMFIRWVAYESTTIVVYINYVQLFK